MPGFAVLLLLLSFAATCSDQAEYVLQPANPPVDIKFEPTDNGYELKFRSQNVGNERFGGFIIFVSESKEDLEKEYNLDVFEENLESGVEKRNEVIVEIMESCTGHYREELDLDRLKNHFLDSPPLTGDRHNIGLAEEVKATITDSATNNDSNPPNLIRRNYFPVCSYLTLRTYLIGTNNEIIRISSPGNVVRIMDDSSDCSK